jgi:hypothetical protein
LKQIYLNFVFANVFAVGDKIIIAGGLLAKDSMDFISKVGTIGYIEAGFTITY